MDRSEIERNKIENKFNDHGYAKMLSDIANEIPFRGISKETLDIIIKSIVLKTVLRRLRQNAHNDEDSLFSIPADTTCKNCGCIINGDEEICTHCGEKLR